MTKTIPKIEWYDETQTQNQVIGKAAPFFNDLSILGRLKATAFGQFYVSKLKKYSLIRRVVLFLWTYGLPFLMNIKRSIINAKVGIYNVNVKIHNLYNDLMRLSISGACRDKLKNPYLFNIKRSGSYFCKTEVLKSSYELINTPVPLFYPKNHSDYFIAPHNCYEFGHVNVIQIENSTVFGRSNLCICSDVVVVHKQYNFQYDFTSEELHGRWKINPRKSEIFFACSIKPMGRIDVAALFMDACSSNYAHWITEVLTKLVLFCNDPKYSEVPLLIDHGLHENIEQSLKLICGERHIIRIKESQRLHVDKLMVVDAAGYVPFDKRGKKNNPYNHGVFSADAFKLIKEKVLDSRSISESIYSGKKVFLRRNSKARNILNIDEVESYLVSQGFILVSPECLTFKDQAVLFATADIIVGATGAAFANLIFRKNEAKSVIFMPRIKGSSFWYWQNIACAVGNSVTYVLGTPNNSKRGVHSSYAIDIKDLGFSIK